MTSPRFVDHGRERTPTTTTPTLDVDSLSISGMQWHDELLWLACPTQAMLATYDPAKRRCELRLPQPGIEHACPTREGIWLQTRGGNLGRQLVLWSPAEHRSLRRIECPDGAASGFAIVDGRLWLSHRRNRKLFCLDPRSGDLLWTIRTERQIFSPTAYRQQLWAVECEPGPLGDWSEESQAAYGFVRFDPAHERVVERHPVPFAAVCVAVNDECFWYALGRQTGLCSLPKENPGGKHSKG